MIRISIEAETGADARRMLMDLIGPPQGLTATAPYMGKVGEVPAAKAEAQPEPAEGPDGPKRRGRKAKADVEDAAVEAEPATAAAEPASDDTEPATVEAEPVKAASVEDVRTTMQAILKKFEGDEGPKQVFALLTEFGVKKASELSEDQRAKFVAKAADKLAA